MYYDIDYRKKTTELGIMIGNKKYWNKGHGTEAVKLILFHIFLNTEIDLVYLHTLKTNLRAQSSFIKSGFLKKNTVRKNGYNFIRMEIDRKIWQSDNIDLNKNKLAFNK